LLCKLLTQLCTNRRMTRRDLAELVGPGKAEQWIGALNETFETYAIKTPLQRAHFLAQILHETGGLKWLRELWGPTPAQGRYEGREDLGNVYPGDGYRYRGRGAIQLTGRYNYTLYARHTGIDVVKHPDLLEQPPHALLVAGWYWQSRRLNQPANFDDLEAVTRGVNGGLNGLDDRAAWLKQAKRILNLNS
jgi:Predicted chitinase